MYLQHCQDKAASTAFAGLWLPPLLTPIVAALVLTVGFFWRAKTTSRAQQRPWLLRGVFLAFLVTFVWTSTGSLEVFMCSDRDLCDPMRCVWRQAGGGVCTKQGEPWRRCLAPAVSL